MLIGRVVQREPASLDDLEPRLEAAHAQLLEKLDAAVSAKQRLRFHATRLALGTRLVLLLIKLKFGLGEADAAALEAYLSPDLASTCRQGWEGGEEEGGGEGGGGWEEAGWEELTTASLGHLLSSTLGGNERGGNEMEEPPPPPPLGQELLTRFESDRAAAKTSLCPAGRGVPSDLTNARCIQDSRRHLGVDTG